MRDLIFTYVFRPLARPLTQLIVRLAAKPTFRMCFHRIGALERLDAELEKDLAEWFRGALLLLMVTANMEVLLWQNVVPFRDLLDKHEWLGIGLRIMLAIAVIQMMPDQELFTVIHPGPRLPPFAPDRSRWSQIGACWKPVAAGLLCQHLSRSSPVFAILAVIFEGAIGWVCYAMALLQYLIIGLVTSRDRAVDVLMLFDEQVSVRRRELARQTTVIGEFDPHATLGPIDKRNGLDQSHCGD